MAATSKGPVFRITGLPASQPDSELTQVLRNAINDNLTERERACLAVSPTIVPSCYNDEQERVALVEFRGGVPDFLSGLTSNSVEGWQIDAGEFDIDFDYNFYGFTQLYKTDPDLPISADVIAITGLDGHAYNSWRGEGNLGRMWLRDFLSKDLPHCRTMIYGYNSKLSSHGIDTIMDYGRGLLEELKKIRTTRSIVERPLFFIAHGFGGIILAHCMVKAVQASEADQPSISAFYKATYGMLLFAIPHKGLVVDDFEQMLVGMAEHPRSALLNQIKSKSDLLEYQLVDFKNLIRDRKVVNFYETGQIRRLEFDSESKHWRRTGDFFTTLAPGSALLELPDAIEDKIPVDASHSTIVKFNTRNHPAYTSAREKLKQFERDAPKIVSDRFDQVRTKSSSSQITNEHWIVPRLVNTLFTGRSKLLDRIQKALHPKTRSSIEDQKRFVISGIGGLGKSEICLKIANLLRQSFWGVFWVDVDNPSTAKNGFTVIAKALGFPTDDVRDVVRVLSNAENPWLLIIDNADDPEFDYSVYIPSGTHGTILMTSRVSSCAQYSTIEPEKLESLDRDHSIQLLLKAAKIPEMSWPSFEEQAEKVVQLLGSHTLALIQAGAYIAEGYCRLHEYGEKFRRQRKRLMKHYPDQEQSRYRDVYATFEASAAVLQNSEDEAAKDALDLLAILSTLHSSILPLWVFRDAWIGSQSALQAQITEKNRIDALRELHISRFPGFIDWRCKEWDDHRLMKASARLSKLSLVTRHDLEDYTGLSMHPLAHAWAKDRLGKEQQKDTWITTGCVITSSQILPNDDWKSYSKEIWPHMDAFLSPKINLVFTYGPQHLILPILLQCGWSLQEIGEDLRLQSLLEDIYQSLEISPTNPSRDYWGLWVLASFNLYDIGDREKLIALYEHIIEFEQSLSDGDNSQSQPLSSKVIMARYYTRMGQAWEVIKLLEDAVRIEKTRREETDSTLLDAEHALAYAYQYTGQIIKSIPLLEHVVRMGEKILAETHPTMLAFRKNLAWSLRESGQTRNAIELMERVLEIKRKTLSENHPDRITSEHNLASAYLDAGQMDAAVELLERAVQLRSNTLPESDPRRLDTEKQLAYAYRWNLQFDKEIEVWIHVVKVYENTVEEKQDDRLLAQVDLATAYKWNGQADMAVRLLEHVTKINEMTLEENNKFRLSVQHNLARYYKATGQFNDAVKLLAYVAKIQEGCLEETSENRLISEHSLATAYAAVGQTDKAIGLMEHVVKIRKSTLSETDPDRRLSEQVLADLLQGTYIWE